MERKIDSFRFVIFLLSSIKSEVLNEIDHRNMARAFVSIQLKPLKDLRLIDGKHRFSPSFLTHLSRTGNDGENGKIFKNFKLT